MRRSNPLRSAAHVIPVAVLSFLLLCAGMCGIGDEPSPAESTDPSAVDFAAPTEEEERALAEAAEEAARERQAAVEAAERELAEREARLAAERERLAAEEARLAAEQEQLRRERELRAEQERLAAERAAAAERERELAELERELNEREAELAQAQGPTEETAGGEPVAPEPLPEPTGTYEGNFDEPWRASQEGDELESGGGTPPAEAGGDAELIERELVPPGKGLVSVQAGERLEVQVVNTLSSATAQVGDVFAARLVRDLRNQAGTLVVPAGAEVRGRVTEAVPYQRGGGPARLGVEFTQIVVSPEQTVGIRAFLAEVGADRKKNRKKVVAGAVVGAILGHILGGDGSKNVIIGAAAGAAAGGAVVASAKDRDAEIPGGQIFALELEEVVTVEIEYGAVAPR